MIQVQIGYETIPEYPGVASPLKIDIAKSCHWLITGGSGSGKSYLLLYVLNSLLNARICLFIADYKGSGDFCTLTPNYAEFEACTGLIECFYAEYQRIKRNKTGERILLIFDEYPGFILWLEGKDKKKATEIKNMIAEILMVGRSLPGGGSAFLWDVCQRADSYFFQHGARDNHMVYISMGRISKESRSMILSSENLPERYQPKTGQGVILEDGRPLRFFQVPEFDKMRMKILLMRKAGV